MAAEVVVVVEEAPDDFRVWCPEHGHTSRWVERALAEEAAKRHRHVT